MTRPDVEVMRASMTPARLADVLEKAIADPDTTADEFGEYVRMHLAAILCALRSSGTGRSEAEASVLPIAMAFLDMAAGEGIFFREDAKASTPEMDAGDLYFEIARRLGHDPEAPEMLALTAAGHEAIRALPAQTTGGGGNERTRKGA